MRSSLLAAALALVSFEALALNGQVVDELGKPIAGAQVQIVGSSASITTDAQGEFTFDEQSVNELHVKAPGFNHKVLHLHELPAGKVTVTLYKGVLEIVDVVGIPVHASVIESSLPVTVLAGDSLRNQQAATLGDTLEKQVGVHSSYHGKVASTPVIRGLSGPRVKITQNGLDVVDASRVGPDHAVATDAATAEQIEILRGPATLFYGSGAIGGVVNVVDKRVPKDSVTEGHGLISYDSVNEQTLMALSGSTGNQWVGIYADGFWRDADDYRIPAEDAPDESHADGEHPSDTVANSAEQSRGGTLGASLLLDNGFVGLSVGRLNRDYGVPGHGGEDESVFAALAQNRYQLLSELDLQNNVLKAIHTRAGFTDYKHAEIEDGEVGTVFTNKTRELRVDLLHREFHHWKGGINFHYKLSDEASNGEEAFAPSSETQTQALAFIEERHFGDVLIQLGARIENVSIDAPGWQRAELELHEDELHEEGEETADEETVGEHEEHEGEAQLLSFNESFTPLSLSFGAVWEFSPGYNIGFSLARAERAPSAAELLSFGPHIGTGAYEIGAMYELHEEDESGESEDAGHEEHHELHFDIGAGKPELEASNNIDLSFRKFEDNVGIIANAFYNRVDNYYYQQATGLFAEAGHAHEDEAVEAEEEDHSSDLPVYQYAVGDATLTGFELQGIWQINERFELSAFADKVNAKLENGGYLPRMPPMRLGAALNFNYDRFQAEFGVTRYTKQNRLAQFETQTDGYTLVNARVDYTLPLSAGELVFFVKGGNLGDEFAQVHTSFLKDEAPRAGRNVSVGVRGRF